MIGSCDFQSLLAGRCPLVVCGLTKQGQRFLSSLATVTIEEPSSALALLRKFVSSSSKHGALTTLSHLISPSTSTPRLSSFVFPLYTVMKRESWFSWNAKLEADLIAFLYKEGRYDEAGELFSEAVLKLGQKERDVCMLLCKLMESHANHKSEKGVLNCWARLRQLMLQSSSGYVKRRGYESGLGGFCGVGLPDRAEELMKEMRENGFTPSGFEFKALVYGYGEVGFLEDMKRVIMEMEKEGYELDTVCCNMVVASLGEHGEFVDMLSWLEKMRNSGIPFSVRSYNSVLNACPTIMLMVQDTRNLPLWVDDLVESLEVGEANVVRELLKPHILDQVMEWKPSELRLDLHGMHLSTAYLILLQWFGEVRERFAGGNFATPAQVLVICGCGKHSSTRGESPVRNLAKEIIARMKCPLRIDRKNIGCFTAKGKNFKNWLVSCRVVTRDSTEED